jgi:uncharacterized protein YbaR (Trm112 family)
MALTRKRIRLEADGKIRASTKMLDVFTSATPEIWRGNDVQFEIGLFFDDVLITDLSNIASLSIDVVPDDDRDGEPVMSGTIEAGDLDDTLDQTSWDDYTKQHALITFTGQEANVSLGGAASKTFWLAVSVVTNDDPSRQITVQCTQLKIVEDGAGSTAAPPSYQDNYYSKAASDARFQMKHGDGASFAFKDGQHPYMYCSDDNLWYPLVVTLVDGVPVLGLGEGVSEI